MSMSPVSDMAGLARFFPVGVGRSKALFVKRQRLRTGAARPRPDSLSLVVKLCEVVPEPVSPLSAILGEVLGADLVQLDDAVTPLLGDDAVWQHLIVASNANKVIATAHILEGVPQQWFALPHFKDRAIELRKLSEEKATLFDGGAL